MRIPTEKLHLVALAAACRALHVPELVVRLCDRSQPGAWVRQVSWWLLDDVLAWPHSLIAHYAQRDRSAISHGVKTVNDRLYTERDLPDKLASARHYFLRATEVEA
jgi:hypothetical protein